MPRCVGQMPLYYNHFNTGRPYDGITPRTASSPVIRTVKTHRQNSYGYGLSYHKAEYGP
ncbi:MAG: hypothetical protein ACLVL2_14450 [Bacteroides cellulosilyticus]